MKRVELKLRARESLAVRGKSSGIVTAADILSRLCAIALTAFFVYCMLLVGETDAALPYGLPPAVFYVCFSVCTAITLGFYAVIQYLVGRWFYACACRENRIKLTEILPIRLQLKIIYLHFMRFSKRFGQLVFYFFPFAVSVSLLLFFTERGIDKRLFALWVILSLILMLTGIGFLLTARQKTAFLDETLSDNKKLSVSDILKYSDSADEKECRYLKRLKLSFIPWFMLCVLIIPLFFVIPYYRETMVQYKKEALKTKVSEYELSENPESN